MAKPVVLTLAVGNCCAQAAGGIRVPADKAAAPTRSSRRLGVRRSVIGFRGDMRRLYRVGSKGTQRSEHARSWFPAWPRLLQRSIRRLTYGHTSDDASKSLSYNGK